LIDNINIFIYIYTKGGINVIKPKALYFESFQDSRWNYFFIEAENVEPIDGVPVSRFGDQLLVEDTPGHYFDVNILTSFESVPQSGGVIRLNMLGRTAVCVNTSEFDLTESCRE
jgi:hypothetical protein